MTWCSHRKGVNEGLSAAATLPAAIKADVLPLLLLLSHLPSPLPPPFHSERLVLVGVRQENTAGRGWGGGGDGGGDVCVVSVVFGGGDSRSALPAQLLSQIGALFTHVPPVSCPSYITHPVQQRTRENATPALQAQIG